MDRVVKGIVILASLVSVGFGVWHFFVPAIWNWYDFIMDSSGELVIAVRAINVFFSASLVLFGLMNLAILYKNKANNYSRLVVLSASLLLWLLRVIMQLVFPQGSASGLLQYSMLLIFITVFLCYVFSLIYFAKRKEKSC